MISTSTFAFALALVVAVLGGLGWITWLHLTRELELLRSTTSSNVKSLIATVSQQRKEISELRREAPSTLAVEVAALHEAVGKLRDTHRRFAGRFDQYVGQQEPASARGADPSYAGAMQLDPELAAELALQNAKPAGPGG